MWLDAVVTMGDPFTYPAQVSTRRWNGHAIARFSAQTMARIVEDFHAAHLRWVEAGVPDAARDVMWDGSIVVVHDWQYPDPDDEPGGLPYSVERTGQDREGWYRFDGAWSVLTQEWPERDAVVARLREHELATQACRILDSLALEPGSPAARFTANPARGLVGPDEDLAGFLDAARHGLSARSSAAREAAVEALELVLAIEGIPAGHLRATGQELYEHWHEQWSRPPF